MNAKEIANQRFDKGFGYKTESVDGYLTTIASYVDQLEKEKASLESKLQILADKIEDYRKDEDSLREALLGAQKLGQTVINDAKAKAEVLHRESKEEAEKLLSDAKAQSEKMLSEAHASADKVVEGTKREIEKEQRNLARMQREVSSFKSKLLNLYKAHLDLITALPEEEKKEEPAKPQPQTVEPAEQSENTAPVESAQEDSVTANTEESTQAVAETKNTDEKIESQDTTHKSNAAKQPFMVSIGEKDMSESPLKNKVPDNKDRGTFESRFGELKFGKNFKKDE